MSLTDYLFGRRLATFEEGEQRVGVLAGIPMLGLDALGSAAYGPEAALTLLIPLGAAGIGYVGPISTLIIILLLSSSISRTGRRSAPILTAGARTRWPGRTWARPRACSPPRRSCSTTCWSSPSASRPASGPWSRPSPRSSPTRSALCLAILAMITLVNLRGVRESGVAFMIPTYLFIVSLLAVLAIGVIKAIAAGGHPAPVDAAAGVAGDRRWPEASGSAMRAFASGCTAMTGVEAVSNGVTAFREPAVPHARKTLTAIIVILAVMLAGIAYLCQAVRHRRDRARPARIPEHPLDARGRGRSAGESSTTSRSARCSASWPCRPTPASPTFPAFAG